MKALTRALKNFAHGIFPLYAVLRYGYIGKKINVVAVTGTDGKSSSVTMIAKCLREEGHRVAHYSSISFHDGIHEFPNTNKMTTPGRMGLHIFLQRAVKNGCTHAVLEITSQGISQHRHRGIGFSTIGITAITPEHIEAHNGFLSYKKTKLRLISSLLTKSRDVFIHPLAYEECKDLLPKNIQLHVIGTKKDTTFEVDVLTNTLFESTLRLHHNEKSIILHTNLGGPCAPDNIIFSATIAFHLGVSIENIVQAIQSIAFIPGRFEIIQQKPCIIVDYAHTLNALTIIIPYVRQHTSGKLIHVFGAAGGGRDSYKRPLIAQLSEQYSNVSIITEENSFDEPVMKIINDIKQGFTDTTHETLIFPKREDAVTYGHSLLLSPLDTLLLTAKGSESVIVGPHRSKRPYCEREYIQSLCTQ